MAPTLLLTSAPVSPALLQANRAYMTVGRPAGLSACTQHRTGNPRAAEAALRTALNMDRHLDRIRFDRTHIVGSIDPVNPVYIYKVEQIHGR